MVTAHNRTLGDHVGARLQRAIRAGSSALERAGYHILLIQRWISLVAMHNHIAARRVLMLINNVSRNYVVACIARDMG